MRGLESGEQVQHLREASLADERQTKELEEILRLDQLQSNIFWDQLFAGAKQNVPYGQTDSVVAVVLAAKSRMVDPVKGRRDHDIGQPFFTRKRDIGMMEEYEKHANEFADDDDMSFNANDDHANALENDLEKLVENVKSQAG